MLIRIILLPDGTEVPYTDELATEMVVQGELITRTQWLTIDEVLEQFGDQMTPEQKEELLKHKKSWL